MRELKLKEMEKVNGGTSGGASGPKLQERSFRARRDVSFVAMTSGGASGPQLPTKGG